MTLAEKIAIAWLSICGLGLCVVGWPVVPIIIGLAVFCVSILAAVIVIQEG
jgi:hypothetical protein